MTTGLDPRALAGRLEAVLRAHGGPGRAAQEKRYLKSELVHLGASVPAVRAAARAALRQAPGLDRVALRAFVDALWARGIHECRVAAVELLEARTDLLGRGDAPWLERLLRGSRTWALVDNLAACVVGPLAAREPGRWGRVLDRWARDPDFWLRRSALLALLLPLRAGGGDFDRFGRYAEALLGDREFFVQKAIGWVLRDTSRRRPTLVASWLVPRAARAGPVTAREAVKHLPAAARARVLATRRKATAGRARRRGHG
jgi:3-methyladenine DNA glycosylase AlkD